MCTSTVKTGIERIIQHGYLHGSKRGCASELGDTVLWKSGLVLDQSPVFMQNIPGKVMVKRRPVGWAGVGRALSERQGRENKQWVIETGGFVGKSAVVVRFIPSLFPLR